ncbi:MAG TPA: FecR domain-containing protein [Rhodocyclaceae bacterium]|nr:FecR domain-containing protein [Rhodocyclaceae bacterium]
MSLIPRLPLLVCLGLAASAVLAAPVAQVADVQGVVTVLRAGKPRPVSPPSNLEEGDVVVTETNSTAVLAFTDGGKVALRPNTRFEIAGYHFASADPPSDNLFFRLLAGGLRTITGSVGKRGNRDAYRMASATATIGIRGTEFTARTCQGDCPGEEAAPVAARVTALLGEASAVDVKGNRRPLALQAPLNAGDRVETGKDAYAGLTFSDDSRLVLRANSQARIADYRFVEAKPESDGFALQLLRGAFRALTGRLGHRNPQKAGYTTATATIGIRGTQWDAWCVPEGYAGDGAAAATGNCDQGLLTAVTDGRIALTNAQGEAVAGAGEAAFVAGPGAAPRLLALPVQLPAPDGAPAPESLPPFPATEGDGLYVFVHEGRVAVAQGGQAIDLGKGEGGFSPAGGQPPVLLQTSPGFLKNDPFLKSVNFDSVGCSL